MTFDPNNPSNLDRRPATAYGLGAGGWTAVIVVVVLLVIGAFYLMSENGVDTTASNSVAPTVRKQPVLPRHLLPHRGRQHNLLALQPGDNLHRHDRGQGF